MSVSTSTAAGTEGGTGEANGGSEIFSLKTRLELSPDGNGGRIELYSKHSESDVNFFALTMKGSGDLLLLCDHMWPFDGSVKGWTIRHIPWFEELNKKISALTFDDEGILFLGCSDGMILEIRVRKVLGSPGFATDSDLLEVCHLNTVKVQHMIVYNQESNKIILCCGENGKFVILTNNTPPVLVTFNSNISSVDLFANKTGLTCALVCLESGQNVYTVLDDLDLPATHESQGKKSIFKKAKDNLMSRLSEDKLSFFGRKSNKDGSPNSSQTQIAPSVLSSNATAPAPSIIVGHAVSQKQSIPLNNVKFQSIEEPSFRGLIRKVKRQNQFYRHANNKLDIFDGDFRQTATIYVPSSVSKLFAINRMHFAVDEEKQSIRVSIVIDSVLKEFAFIPFPHKVLQIEPFGEEGTPYTVFVIAEDGLFEMHLKKTPMETCVDLMLSEAGNNVIDAVCTALNVPKTQVCVMAGDVRSEEGKFSKTIIYYKLAGLSYAQICAKFGSRGQIAAMLFFYELVDQERTKFVGGRQERQLMTDLALLGRIEQYIRHGSTRSELSKNPETLLKGMLVSNLHYSSAKAAQWLATPALLWALRILGKVRCCHLYILSSLHFNEATLVPQCHQKKLFWKLMFSDWMSLYTTEANTFIWLRALVWQFLRLLETPMLLKIIQLLLPWRRELQRKIFTEVSDLAHVIDFTTSPDADHIVVDDYVSFFIVLLIEVIRRKEKKILRLPEFVFKADARLHQKKEIANHKNNMIATMMLSYNFVKAFSASSSHCVCVRNGRLYTWGENKFGKLGLGEQKIKTTIETPTPVCLSPSLKLFVESVSAGLSHNIALTNVGTLLVYGSNKYGQLGIGKMTTWTGRPVPIDIPHVIFTCISAGSYHTVALDHLNRVWTWGWGVFGQLGNGGVENVFVPTLLNIEDKIVFVSAGHSHTALLTCYGRVLLFGCNHFGQLGIGTREGKVKAPTLVTALPAGTLVRLVECGVCCTVMVTTKNRLFYCGLNPASLKSLLSGSKKKDRVPPEKVLFEEKDFNEPTLFETGHLAGDISRVSAASTHFGVMTSLGYVYTWGIGKSGQLARNDDDTKTLELIDCDNKTIVASDICCAGDCTFVVERDTGHVYGCGFNSSGQIGKMESDEEHSVMTVRTKKRVVKIRQPSNIYFRLKEIPGLPKQLSWEGESSVIATHKIVPHTNIIGQELLEWCLNVFRRNYDAKFMTERCVEAGNHSAASLLETLAENHEQALKYNLDAAGGNQKGAEDAIEAYCVSVDQKTPSTEQACRFLALLINHWSKYALPSSDLEEILERHHKNANWGQHINQAIKEFMTSADDSGQWLASNFTPLFILRAIKETETSGQFSLVTQSSMDKEKGPVNSKVINFISSSDEPESSTGTTPLSPKPPSTMNGL